MKNNSNIEIILAYKDGDSYIEDQLNSILGQNNGHFHINLFDDFSNTKFNKKNIERVGLLNSQITIKTNSKNLGYCKNFLNGLETSPDNAEFYSFCDQDDIWYKNKLKIAINSINRYPEDIPCLYCTRTEIVDETGHLHLGHSPLFKKQACFANALVQNIGGGNTMVMNKAARKILIEASKNVDVVSHDWWAYIVISGVGGIVIYDERPSLKYRQHNNNLIGRNNEWKSRLVRIKSLFEGRFSDWNRKHIKALKQNYHLLSEKNKRILDLFIITREETLIKRLYFFYKSGIFRQTLLGNFGLLISVLLKKI